MNYPVEPWPEKGSFADGMIKQGIWGLHKLSGEIEYLTEEHLEYSLACFLANRKNRRANKDVEYYALKVSQDVLWFFMGENRFFQEVMSKGDAFFNIRNDSENGYRYMARVHSLASIIYNLQGVPGIQHRIETLKKDDLESILGEMECARLIFNSTHDLRFIVPAKNSPKGTCYDAEFTTPKGRVVHCEFKAKETTTIMTPETVWSTCEHARTQLPKGKPGIIFLRMPETWTSTPNFKDAIRPGLEKAVRQSSRIVAIVLAWEVWLTKGGAERACLHLFDSWLNRRGSLFGEDVEQSIMAFRNHPDRWLNIKSFVAANIENLKLRIPID